MEKLTAEQSRTILNYLLPSIEAEHKITRMTIQSIRPDLLNATVPGGQTISDLVWQIVATEHLYLTGICEARIPAMEAKPADHSVPAILGWYNERFKSNYEGLSQLTGEELLRPVEVFGQTKPVVDYLPICMSVTTQNRGLLAGYLAALPVQQTSGASAKKEEATAHGSEDGELGEHELAGIVGGDSSGTVLTMAQFLSQNPGSVINVPTTMNAGELSVYLQQMQNAQNENTMGGLGSLFGGGVSGAMAGGLTGAVLAESAAVTGAVNAAAAAAAKSAQAAVLAFDVAAM
jgi:hypothetical protein